MGLGKTLQGIRWVGGRADACLASLVWRGCGRVAELGGALQGIGWAAPLPCLLPCLLPFLLPYLLTCLLPCLLPYQLACLLPCLLPYLLTCLLTCLLPRCHRAARRLHSHLHGA